MDLKIFVPDVRPELIQGELKNIILAGIESNSSTRLCADAEEASYIFLDFRHLENMGYEPSHPDKTVIIDYRDNPLDTFPHECLLYFKRSVVDTLSRHFVAYPREVIPIGYCVRNEYLNRQSELSIERDIDVAVFFDPNESPATARNKHRCRVARHIQDRSAKLNVFTGIAGDRGARGRNVFQPEYFKIMARAKIVVTCNPDRWEGDNRLFEALSSGSLVLSDSMITPVENPLADWEHLVYYDKEDLGALSDIIDALLANNGVRRHIASAGYDHAMQYHTASSRIDEIIRVLAAIDT